MYKVNIFNFCYIPSRRLLFDFLIICNIKKMFVYNPMFQCFLLDKDNKVLVIGNPVNNPQIYDLNV
jgi:hypothetical protein